MGPTGKTRAVQIHPTRRCNLQCLHCYSSSSPHANEAIEIDVLRSTLDELADEGYDWASFSGGEPLTYKALPDALAHARKVGIHTSMVSNGMLLTPRRLDTIQEHTDLLVIPLDGKPESHNRMRNSAKAFDAMATKLPDLQARGIDFGFLFTLTQYNLDELPWVVEFAVNTGAKLLQIHPLEYFGNAIQQMSGNAPDAIEGAHAWYLAEKLKDILDGRMALQVDLVHTDALHQQPQSFFIGDRPEGRLSDMLSPLVIEPDGEVLPLQYGFSRDYSLGNLRDLGIREMTEVWRGELGDRFHRLCQQLFDEVHGKDEWQFFNWYEQVAVLAQREHQIVPEPLPLPSSAGMSNTAV